MKYQHTAKGLASLGRHGDNTLLHVSKDELAGLQQLLGQPLTVNPETGLHEAFKLSTVLPALAMGVLGAVGAAPIAGALGLGGNALASGAIGAGLGGLGGGAISAMQGKGFGPGALGGAISGGLGGFGGSGLTGESAPTAGGINPEALSALEKSSTQAALHPEIAQASGPIDIQPTSSFSDALGKQASAAMTKEGMMDLLKPVGLGVGIGTMAQDSMLQAQQYKKQQEAAQQQAQTNEQNQQNYFASLGYPLPAFSPSTSTDVGTQRNYYLNLLYPHGGYAAGGPVTTSRMFAGIPLQTTFPARYVDEFERSDVSKELPEAFQGLQQLAGNVGLAAQKAEARRMAMGGYLNNTLPPQEDQHPQSLIPKAAPQPGAAPVRQEVVQNYADGGSVYEKGGFLDGPGDGQSDDIPANIDGQEEVRLADGEFIIPPEIVRMLGYGDPEKGAKLLDNLLPMVRQASFGTTEQIKQDAAKKVTEKLVSGSLAETKMRERHAKMRG